MFKIVKLYIYFQVKMAIIPDLSCGLLLFMDVYCGLDESLSAYWNGHDF